MVKEPNGKAKKQPLSFDTIQTVKKQNQYATKTQQ
jgi:hypothetical protein